MSRDDLYAQDPFPDGPFEFSDAVADVFPDMLRRSIPGYSASLQAIRSLTREYAQGDTNLYDLGCSLGAATRAMQQGVAVDGCRIVAVDNAPAMVRRCRAALAEGSSETPVDVRLADVVDTPIDSASVVVMNYTLQFIAPERRPALLARIAEGLKPGGIFILSEKVVHADPAIESALARLHLEFKRRHQYTDLEISRKRQALENVLVPDTIETHMERLAKAGFAHSGVWLRYFNFVSLIAIR